MNWNQCLHERKRNPKRNLWYALKCGRVQSELSVGSVKSHYSAAAEDFSTDLCVWSLTCGSSTTITRQWCVIMPKALWFLFISARLTSLLLFVIGEFLDGAAMAEAADWTGKPFSQSVSGAFGTRRAGLQRAEGRLRLKVRHRLRLPIRATNGIVFWKESDVQRFFSKIHSVLLSLHKVQNLCWLRFQIKFFMVFLFLVVALFSLCCFVVTQAVFVLYVWHLQSC